MGVVAIGAPIAGALAADGFMLATGRSTGKSYAVGVGITSLAKVKLLPSHKMDVSVVETEGFVENVRLLEQNKAQFAVLQAMFGHFARTGTGTFAGEPPNDDIRAIAMLWRDADHFVMDRNFVTTGTVADLQAVTGQPVSMGVNGPGPIESNRLLLSHLGMDIDQNFHLSYLNYNQSSEALLQGKIKAMSTPIRPPAPHIQAALGQSGKYQILEFTDEQIAKADGGLGLWSPYVIPAATYPGQDRDIKTVAKSNLLVARTDVDDEVVYQVTKAMFENLDFLRNIHDAMYETSLDRALTGVPIPLHPGALRYYKEVGLLAPDANLEVALSDQVRSADKARFTPTGALSAGLQQAGAEPRPQPAAVTDVAATAAPPAPSLLGDEDSGKTFVVYFDLGEQAVAGQAMQEISEAIAYADQMTSARIQVTGHTDNSGDPVFNAYLSKVRAEAVVDAMQRFGASGHEIVVQDLGSSAPAIANGREYEPRNRRVEITILPLGQASADAPAAAEPAWQKRAPI
jgi:TRAP transporter TAXI family solute receptor